MDTLGSLLTGFIFAITSIFQVTWPFWLGVIIWRLIRTR